jgi:hypothetical protein
VKGEHKYTTTTQARTETKSAREEAVERIVGNRMLSYTKTWVSMSGGGGVGKKKRAKMHVYLSVATQ